MCAIMCCFLSFEDCFLILLNELTPNFCDLRIICERNINLIYLQINPFYKQNQADLLTKSD